MTKELGRVIKVFIPVEAGEDIMYSTKIGFKVQTDSGVIEIIEEADEYNSTILREDKVIITKQTIDGKEYTDIEKYEEDNYE